MNAKRRLLANNGHRLSSRAPNSICRLCGERAMNLIPIFENNYYIAEKISRCLPVSILNTDKLSLFICKKCLELLNTTYTFIEKVCRVNEMFQQQIKHENENPLILNGPIDLSVLKKIAPTGPVNCDICDKTFVDMEKFDYHIEYEHLLLWRCKLCHCSYNSYDELAVHENEHVDPINTNDIEQSDVIEQNIEAAKIDHAYVVMDVEPTEIIIDSKNSQKDSTDSQNNFQESERSPTIIPAEDSYSTDTGKENELDNSMSIDGKLNINSQLKDDYSSSPEFVDSAPKLIVKYKRYKCNYCEKNYASIYYRQRHVLDCHPTTDVKEELSSLDYECNICKKHFTVASNFQLHMRVHDDDQRKKCKN